MEKKTLTEKIVDGLNKTVNEIEELRVQAALGKAEARDLFEENKKKFSQFISKTKASTLQPKEKFRDGAEKVKKVLKDIESAIDTGLSDSKEAFDRQKKNLDDLANNLDKTIGETVRDGGLAAEAKHEIERFKLKMEVLKLQFDLKRLDTKKDFEIKKAKYLEKVNNLKARLDGVKDENEKSWEVLKKDVDLAYRQLKESLID